MVRIIKKMKYLMIELNYSSAKNISSFALESLLWNIPNDVYKKYGMYRFAFEEVINYAYDNINLFNSYFEANGIKNLCHDQTSVDELKNFISDLKLFYQYDI